MGNANTKLNLEYTQSVPNSSTATFSPVYISPNKVEKLEPRTLFQLLQLSCEKYINSPCLGYRDPTYQWITYTEMLEASIHLGQGLINLSLYSKEAAVGICTSHRHEALLVDMALLSQSIPSIHFLPLDQISIILSKLQLRVIFCDEYSVQAICEAKSNTPGCSLTHLIQFDQAMEKTQILAREHNVRLCHISEVISASSDIRRDPRFSTCYSVTFSPLYEFTMISHSNLISNLEGMSSLKIKSNEIYYSYQSLRSLQQRVIIYYMICKGGRIGFGVNLSEDLALLSPSIVSLTRWHVKSIYSQLISKRKTKTLVKLINNCRVLILSTPGLRSGMLGVLIGTLCCSVIRIFGNHLCGVLVISNICDKNHENSGGPVTGIETSIESHIDLQLSCKEINTDGQTAPRGVIYAKGGSIAVCGLDCVLDCSPRGVRTGLIATRNRSNGSISCLGLESYLCLRENKGSIIFQFIEGAYLEIEGLQDVYVFINGGKVTGIAIAEDNIDPESIRTVDSTLKDFERVECWIVKKPSDHPEIAYLPYALARLIMQQHLHALTP